MRVSTAMQHKGSLKMMNSEAYKKHFKDQATKPSTNDPVKDTQSLKIGDKLLVEKKGDKITISQLDKDQKKSTIQELSAQTDQGKQLIKLMNLSETSKINQTKNQIRNLNSSASLANYL